MTIEPGGAATSPAPTLPELNAGPYPFRQVEAWLDEAAWLHLQVEPGATGPRAYRASDAFDLTGGFVVRPNGNLRPLAASLEGARVRQRVGPEIGSVRARWTFAGDDLEWSPRSEPRAVLFDPGRAQRFAVQEAEIAFGDGAHLTGYGLGQTYPIVVEGRRHLLAGAVCNVTGGGGGLEGMTGVFVFNGRITSGLAFAGSLLVRLLDSGPRLHGGPVADAPAAGVPASPDATYLVLRGQKRDPQTPSLYTFDADRREPIGVDTPAQVFNADYRVELGGPAGLRTELRVGRPIGSLDATVMFDITEPPGTAERPNGFRTRNTYRFTDRDGRVVGVLRANVELGRTFHLTFAAAPGQAGLRYGGVGPIVGSSGIFAGAQGMVAVNSAVGLSPHALSLLNVLRIVDPQGTFRERMSEETAR